MATARATPRRDGSIRRNLAELAERQGWVHHVADAASGKVITTPLDRPVAPLSRTERLSRLGQPFDPSIFGGPTYRLTPRAPYQASPLAWLTLYKVNIDMPDGENLAWWSLPSDLGVADPPGLRAYIAQPPQGRCVVTLALTGNSWTGPLGHVLIRAFNGGPAPATIRLPFSGAFAEHTVDLIVVPNPGRPVEVHMDLEPGLHLVTFSSLAMASQPVLDPGTL